MKKVGWAKYLRLNILSLFYEFAHAEVVYEEEN